MFTGIVQAIGTIAFHKGKGGDVRLGIDAPTIAADIAPGDSVCVSGVCLTAAACDRTVLAFDVSRETLSLTTLGGLRDRDRVNLEPALRLSDRVGGHLLSGHVDGVGRIAAIEPEGRSQRWWIEVPRPLLRYIVAKGSVGVDGVSLTVNRVDDGGFEVNLIPHTLDATTFGALRAGDALNIEVDLLARYLERLLDARH